jgi:hypothetical protein
MPERRFLPPMVDFRSVRAPFPPSMKTTWSLLGPALRFAVLCTAGPAAAAAADAAPDFVFHGGRIVTVGESESGFSLRHH